MSRYAHATTAIDETCLVDGLCSACLEAAVRQERQERIPPENWGRPKRKQTSMLNHALLDEAKSNSGINDRPAT